MNDGLPSNQVYDFHQDRDGVIWMVSDRGLIRFNGRDFKTFDTHDGIPHSTIFKLFPQENGRIWAATSTNELFHFHPDTMVFHSYEYNSILSAIDGDQIRSLEVNDQGIRFRYVLNFGYVGIDKEGKVTKNYFGNRFVEGHESQLQFVEHENFTFISSDSGLSSNYAPLEAFTRDLFLELGDTLVRSDYNRLVFYYPDKTTRSINNKKILESSILDIGLDKESIWVATRFNGVFLIDSRGDITDHVLAGMDATHYFVDQQGGMWVSTLTNGVFYIPNRDLLHLDATRDHSVSSLSIGKDSNLVVGTVDTYFLYFDEDLDLLGTEKTTLTAKYRYYPYEDKVVVNRSVVQNSQPIYSLSDRIDTSGLFCNRNIVYNSSGEEVYRSEKRIFDVEYFKSSLLISDLSGLSLVSNNRVIDIYSSENLIVDIDIAGEFIYCSTLGDGLHVLDRNLELTYKIDRNSGLGSNFINSTAQDGDTLWICTRKGLEKSYLENEKRITQRISQNTGLLSNEVKMVLPFEERIIVGTVEGVNYFERSNWKQIQSQVYTTKIRPVNILVGDRNNKLEEPLSYDENRIQVDFELIRFPTINVPDFEYRLIGLEDSWNMTIDNSIIYHSLPPGDYRLEIRQAEMGLTTNAPLHLSFSIDLPYYQEWWFTAGVIAFIVFFIWLFFKYKVLRYNPVVMQEILSNINARLKPGSKSFVIRSNGKDVRLNSNEVQYVESSGNYIQIYCGKEKYLVREKLSAYRELVPDPENYLQLRRSLIIRLDKVEAKTKNSIQINGKEFKVGNTYLDVLRQIEL